MYRNLIISFAVVFVVCFVAQPATSDPKVGCEESVAEKCILQLYMLNDKQLPNTTEKLNHYCGQLKATHQCLKDHGKKCLTPMSRRAGQIAIAGISRSMKKLCKSAEVRKAYLNSVKCGNAILPDMKSCISDYKMKLYGAQQVEVKQKLPILCCKFYDFRRCARKAMDKAGPEICPDSSRKFVSSIADAFQSDVFDLICSEYDDNSDVCVSVVVPEVEPSDDTKSFIKPLKEVIKSILEETDKQ